MKTISTQDAPDAVGPYSQAIYAGDTLYISGQLGLNPETGLLESSVEGQAAQIFTNLEAIAHAAGLTLANAVKFNVYLSDMRDFPKVNEIMAAKVARPYPARACVGVNELPRDAKIEIDATLVRLE